MITNWGTSPSVIFTAFDAAADDDSGGDSGGSSGSTEPAELYLIKDGIPATALHSVGNSTGTITEDGLYFLKTDGNYTVSVYGFADVTEFDTLKLELVSADSTVSRSWKGTNVPAVYCSASVPYISSDNIVLGTNAASMLASATGNITAGTYTADISGLSGVLCIGCSVGGSSSFSSTNGKLYIKNLWLE